MINVTKKLFLTFSFIFLYSSCFVAIGSNIEHLVDEKNVIPTPMTEEIINTDATNSVDSSSGEFFPKELMVKFFKIAAAEGIDPYCLARTCLYWNKIMHGRLEGEEGNARFVPALEKKEKVPYKELNDFMKHCLQLYWKAQFRDRTLRNTLTNGDQEINLKISDIANPFLFGL